jgi:hypothetical protein
MNPFTNAKIIGQDVKNADYIRTDLKRGDLAYPMSRSELCLFAECPLKWIGGYRNKASAEMLWGSLVDWLALTPDDFSREWAIQPETYPAAKGEIKPWSNNATYCRQWRKEQAGKRITDAETLREVETAVHTLKASFNAILSDCKRQVLVTAEYHDERTDITIPVKGLIDIVPNGEFARSLMDLKTLRSAKLRDWQRGVFEFGYHIQAAMYLDLWNAATGEQRDEFRHLLQENEWPYVTARRYLSVEFLDLGRTKYQNALSDYCRCLKTGIWPDYDTAESNLVMQIDGWTITQPETWMI